MKQAILSVTVDEKNTVEVRFQGEPEFHIPMLGSLSFAKDWLIDRIKTTQNFATSEGQTAEERQERIVTKSEAVNLYLDARQKIEDRLQSIVRSDEQAKFTVNDSLISNL